MTGVLSCVCGGEIGTPEHARSHTAWLDAQRDMNNSMERAMHQSQAEQSYHDLQSAMVGVLDEILAELKQLNARFASSADARSSVEIKTSTRGVDVAVKSYAGSDILPAESAAVASYFRTLNGIQDRLNEALGGGK